jgi:DNA polymerase I-like protein with 3'-5' exonuclease and polymerase domains
LVSIDLSQIEYRVMTSLQALYFQEQGEVVPPDAQMMVDTFVNQFSATTEEEKAQYDIHTTMARLWGLIDRLGDAKLARKIGKNISFANMFGAGDHKVGRMSGVPTKEAGDLRKNAKVLNPSFDVFQKSVWRTYEENGGVGHTYFGRRLVYVDMCLHKYNKREQTLPSKEVVPLGDVGWRKASAERQSFNARIQGTEADIVKYLTLCIIVHAWELGARLMASVHDELIFCCPEENSDILCAYLNESFRRTDLLPMVPVEGEAKKGKTWYECK